jgi:hypothetical protein
MCPLLRGSFFSALHPLNDPHYLLSLPEKIVTAGCESSPFLNSRVEQLRSLLKAGECKQAA